MFPVVANDDVQLQLVPGSPELLALAQEVYFPNFHAARQCRELRRGGIWVSCKCPNPPRVAGRIRGKIPEKMVSLVWLKVVREDYTWSSCLHEHLTAPYSRVAGALTEWGVGILLLSQIVDL